MDLSKMELPSNHPFAVAEQVIPCSLQRPPHTLSVVSTLATQQYFPAPLTGRKTRAMRLAALAASEGTTCAGVRTGRTRPVPYLDTYLCSFDFVCHAGDGGGGGAAAGAAARAQGPPAAGPVRHARLPGGPPAADAGPAAPASSALGLW